MHASITLPWADGRYTFRLGLKQIEELEENADLSLFQIAQMLDPHLKQAKLLTIREVIRLGLVGGGSSPIDSLKLCERYIEERPLDENRHLAYAISIAGLARVHPDKPKGSASKKKRAAK